KSYEDVNEEEGRRTCVREEEKVQSKDVERKRGRENEEEEEEKRKKMRRGRRLEERCGDLLECGLEPVEEARLVHLLRELLEDLLPGLLERCFVSPERLVLRQLLLKAL